jgi:tetratricopeptide (TPR) repeat protein
VDEVRRSAVRPSQAEAAAESFERARELLERDRGAAAVQAAEQAKALAPRSGAVREVLGIGLYRAGRYREALRELQAYRRITGRLDQNHLIADSYRAVGAPEKAVPVARDAVRARISEASRAEAAVVGASALADLGRYAEAVGLLRSFPVKSGATHPSDLRLWYVTGDVLQRAGRPREAAAEFRRIVRHEPGAYDAAERLAALGG